MTLNAYHIHPTTVSVDDSGFIDIDDFVVVVLSRNLSVSHTLKTFNMFTASVIRK